MFGRIFKWNAKVVNSRPKLVLLVAFIFTVISGFFATKLSMELSWVSMAPSDSPAVKEYEEILDNFPSLDSILVLVESNDYDLLVDAVKETTESIAELDEYVTSVVAGIETDFMLENALMLMDEDEVELMGYAFYDANLTSFYQLMFQIVDETAKKAGEDTLTDEQVIYSASAIKSIGSIIEQSRYALQGNIDNDEIAASIERLFTGDGIMTSPDGKMAMITVQPSFDIMDEVNLVPGVDAIESTIKHINDKFDGATIRGTGMHFVARDEIASIMNDSYIATILSVILIIALLYFAFRIWLAPAFTVTPLIFGIIWAMGIVGFVIGRLNMMTVFAVAMLAGLGIDYSIHLYSSYTERRASKVKKKKALAYAICRTGPSIIVGALTTTTAFFALNISKLKILSELGTVMGTGIITTLVAVFWVLPAIITLKKEKKKNIKRISGNYRIIGKTAHIIYKAKFLVLTVILIGVGFMGYKASQVGFDMNLMNMEPKGLESIELMEHMVNKYDTSSTNLSVQADSLDEVFDVHEKLEAVESVADVTSIVSVLPPMEDQEKRLETAEDIKALLLGKPGRYPVDRVAYMSSLDELELRLTECGAVWTENELAVLNQSDFDDIRNEINTLGDMLNEDTDQDLLDGLSGSIYDSMGNIEDKIMSVSLLTPSDLPEAYKSQFVSEDGKKFLVTIYPDFDIWEELGKEKCDMFLEDLTEISPDITGTPIFMLDLHNAVAEELLMMGSILLGVLLMILIIHFRSVKYALLAFLPLAFTMVYTIGIMKLINLKFNMVNFLVILLIIGIGLDDGVHILHHYKEGERNIKKLFSRIGRAILLTTVTTVFGFGSLSFSSYTGIAGTGILLAIGVSLALVFTVLALPIFLRHEKKKRK